MSLSPFIQCPNCRIITYDAEMRFRSEDQPLPCCNVSGQIPIIWPTLEVHKFLEIVHSQNLDSADERRIAIVFLCTAEELLLENILWELLELHTESRQLADLVLESQWGSERHIQLYNKLSGQPLGDFLKSKNKDSFLQLWDQLSKLRNDIIHGKYYASAQNEKNLIQQLLNETLLVFVLIHNEVQRIKKVAKA